MRPLLSLLALSLLLGACKAKDPAAEDRPGQRKTGAHVTLAEGLEPGYARKGAGLREFDLDQPDPEACQKACNDDAACQAFTFIAPGFGGDKARCVLEDSVPEKAVAECCVSGVKAP